MTLENGGLGTPATSPPHSRRGETDQTVYKPGSVPPSCEDATIIPLDRPLLDGSRDLPEPYSASDGLVDARPTRGPYSVLLQAGLAMPSLSPGPRWALTPPFHPSRPVGRRFAFCGAIPGITPGGRYPPPCHRGARTFLDPLARTATARPSGPGRCLTGDGAQVNFSSTKAAVGIPLS